jgi:hypothetical protein
VAAATVTATGAGDFGPEILFNPPANFIDKRNEFYVVFETDDKGLRHTGI